MRLVKKTGRFTQTLLDKVLKENAAEHLDPQARPITTLAGTTTTTNARDIFAILSDAKCGLYKFAAARKNNK